MRAKNEANASEIEGINTLTEPDRMKEETGVGEIEKKEARHERSEKHHVGKTGKEERSENKENKTPTAVIIIRAEVVKALLMKSLPHTPESPALLTCARICHDSAVHPNLHR